MQTLTSIPILHILCKIQIVNIQSKNLPTTLSTLLIDIGMTQGESTDY